MRAESIDWKDILARIDEQAACAPHSIAVEHLNKRLTYDELVKRSFQIAAALKNGGVEPGSLVAVCLNRSLDFPAVVTGILRAGAAYLPIDPSLPEQRIEYMLDDAGVTVVIANAESSSCLTRAFTTPEELTTGSDEQICQRLEPDDLAYVIYTSGSTGRPKGVEVLHRSLTLCVDAVCKQLELDDNDTVLAITSPSFDVSVMEMFVTLAAGAKLAIFPQERLFLAESLETGVETYQPTLLFGTPALWRLLVDRGWKGSARLRAVTGGETLDPVLASQVLERTQSLWNHYGPTECTIVATTYRVHLGETPCIGFALPHVRLYVVDGDGRRVSGGVPGELYIGGDSVARGYRNHPELTAARFVEFESEAGVSERVYKTGDIVCQRTDGALEFVGRVDNQVKIRGFRIELEEIEAALHSCSGVAEGAVIPREVSNGERALVAYYRSHSLTELPVKNIRASLSEQLPAYMVPARFIYQHPLPLTPSGKLDRIALSVLPLPDEGVESEIASRQAVYDPVTTELVSIWRRLLKTRVASPESNFFELGGHSMLAARMFEEIERRFHKELPLATLFEAATLGKLAKVISGTEATSWSPLVEIRSGQGLPFFCVHPIGGNVLIFRNLSAHMPGRPFYGLQARGLSKHEAPHTSIDEMAADYLVYVKQVQPVGPYFLGGYSAGGLVAFEMARMLEARGETVELIVLFDSYLHPLSLSLGHSETEPQPSAFKRPFRAVSRRIVQMRQTEDGKRMAIVVRDMARLWSTVKIKAFAHTRNWKWNPVRMDAVSAFLFAIRNYRPQPLNARVTLFLADFNAPTAAKILPAVWNALVTGVLYVHHLATDHDHLLDAPFAAELATTIETQIEECLSAKGGAQGISLQHNREAI